jgi:D-xylose transport system permease protein
MTDTRTQPVSAPEDDVPNQNVLVAHFNNYIAKVRGGDVGALPAFLGLVLLVVIFSLRSGQFLTVRNLADIPAEGAGTALIALGLVFVLLLGEIDLSAGTAAGACAGFMGVAVSHGGNLKAGLGSGIWLAMLVFIVAAIGISALNRIWWAAGVSAVGLILDVSHLGSNPEIAVLIAITAGTSIGIVTGFLVAKIGIPSFVVTLALFLGWQGVLLQILGNGGNIPVGNIGFINGLANSNIPPMLGWVLLVVVMGGYLAYTVSRSIRLRAHGLVAEPLVIVALRGAVLTAVGVASVYFLNRQRAPNPKVASIRGVPWAVVIVLAIMIVFGLLLGKTRFGRYIYAVGGNAEASRRAGIAVPRIRIAAFAISSSVAALGGVVLGSSVGGIATDLGGGNQLLYAVGAAVIGGTSLFGGRGRPRDAVIGALVITLLPNGLTLLNLGSSANFALTCIVLLAAASVDATARRRSAASGT